MLPCVAKLGLQKPRDPKAICGGIYSPNDRLKLFTGRCATATSLAAMIDVLTFLPFSAITVRPVRFMITYCEKWNITYVAIFIIVYNHLRVVTVVFLLAETKQYKLDIDLFPRGPPCSYRSLERTNGDKPYSRIIIFFFTSFFFNLQVRRIKCTNFIWQC